MSRVNIAASPQQPAIQITVHSAAMFLPMQGPPSVHAAAQLSPAYVTTAAPSLLLALGGVLRGAHIQPHTRQQSRCCSALHSASLPPGGKKDREKPSEENSAGDAVPHGGQITILNYHSLLKKNTRFTSMSSIFPLSSQLLQQQPATSFALI